MRKPNREDEKGGCVPYWLDSFTPRTWKEFLAAGSNVSGFRESQKAAIKKIQPGDIFLCYLTGVQRWVGALEVLGVSKSRETIWSENDFPVRFAVKPLVTLAPEFGVPMDAFAGAVDFYKSPKDKGKFKGFVRRSPNLFRFEADGKRILDAVREAARNPVDRPVDPKKLKAKVYQATRREGKREVATSVTVPEPEDVSAPRKRSTDEAKETTLHAEIQYRLLRLAGDMGINAWVARNDRNKSCAGKRLGAMPGMVDELPVQFNDATTKTIELIDVLWLRGNTIVAAFEVESTTSVYSGLLRMSDLLALQPNLDIRLFIVAPDDRRSKVEQEILRPTFKLREKPLNEICGFLPFDAFKEKVDAIATHGLASSLKPDFLETFAEYFREE
ncbi:hypothetical protein K8I61_18245 [bacterium]|nr:hypothetical protein [bacterium]